MVARHIGVAVMSLAMALGACSPAPSRSTERPPTSPRLPAPWVQKFVDHDGVRIEYRVRAGTGVPVLLVPGMTASAAYYEEASALTVALGDRPLVALSLRGRGQSSLPDTGYTPADHHGDIRAVVDAEKLHRYHLVMHSMGVAYGLGFALGRPAGEIVSFTAGDYFPAVMQVSTEWAANVDAHHPSLGAHILREQGAVDYADRLSEMAMPLLVILGTESMEPAVAALWAKAPHHRVLWIADGHGTFKNTDAIAATAAHLRAAN